MKKIITIICIILSFNCISAQDYFQQEVNYTIEVTLDDKMHTLAGNIEMEYTNNSPDELPFIYMHLWPNAYRHKRTAFAKQALRTGNTDFYFAEKKDLGKISKLDFKVNNNVTNWEYLNDENPDIAKVFLEKPLKSGKKIKISTPFVLKIPASFSRLGHVEQSYQITQWYPKPAVYDKNGWHPMPYLNMGEFYSEFGSFEVTISLPENYIVGATGELQTLSEHQFLDQKSAETTELIAKGFSTGSDFPVSSEKMKTIRYTAQKVHDFAWFADKRFHVQKGDTTLASGKKVTTWAMFTNKEAELWKDAITYLNRSVRFYSDMVGEYPYSHATAVQSALSAGGGMEYPMITVIGLSGDAKALDLVITHEVGHNWFYGILATNERDHAWMDEGLNTYYERRYLDTYYSSQKYNVLPPMFANNSNYDIEELGYLFQARRRLDQAPETHSDDFSSINYWLSAYTKPAVSLELLESYIGTTAYDELMQGYFKKWQFKHPQPEDLQQHFEENTKKDLGWLFQGLISSNAQVDYAIKSISAKENEIFVTVVNKGQVAAPFAIATLKENLDSSVIWQAGFLGEKIINLPYGEYDKIVISPQHLTPDVNRKNNQFKKEGLLKSAEPLKFKVISGVENPQQNTLYYMPFPAWNKYDGLMAGVSIYNSSILPQTFEFALAPAFGFKSKDLTGLAEVTYNIYPKAKAIHKISVSTNWKSFNYFHNDPDDYDLNYHKISPGLSVHFGKKNKSNFYQKIEWKSNFLSIQNALRDSLGAFIETDRNNTVIHTLKYVGENRKALNPFSYTLAFEQQNYDNSRGEQSYLRASLDFKFAATYRPDRHIDFRIFVGGFLKNTQKERNTASPAFVQGTYDLAAQAATDYAYNDFYFGRSENDGLWSQQISLREGGLKTPLGNGLIGTSNDFIFALNMKADLPEAFPLDLPIKPYFDIGYYEDAPVPLNDDSTFEDKLLWSGGFMLDFFDGILGIYFPVINSSNVKTNLEARGNYWDRISFSLDLNRLHPWKLRDEAKLF